MVFAFIAAAVFTLAGAEARAETRTLKLYYVHTGERAEITFKRNGRYDKKGLEQLNWFLRDWRHNEPTNMDPRLFDLVWETYQQVGGKDYINVLSAYRSPATNSMLRKKTSGVAKNSQHIQGKAMDFYIPGVPLAKLRATAMKMQRGGVGYYPTSGSPFVHLDVASVRAWPRMSRSQLTALFPQGHTLHLPSDGKPLPGYSEALAEYKAKGSVSGSQSVRVASNNDDGDEDERPNLISMLFGRNSGDNNKQSSGSAPAPTRQRATPSQPVQRPVDVLTAAVSFDNLDIPLPVSRPGSADQGLGTPLATALVDPNPPAPETEAPMAIAANIPLPKARPASLEGDGGMSVADVLVSDAADPVEAAEPVEVASLAPGSASDAFDLVDGSVPVPSPRLAYAGLTSEGRPLDAASRDFDVVPNPDPRHAARKELAHKLDKMGNTAVIEVDEENDFRALFRTTEARINAEAPEYPVRAGRPGDALLVSLEEPSAAYDGEARNIGKHSESYGVEDMAGLVKTNKVEQKGETVSQYFDLSRF